MLVLARHVNEWIVVLVGGKQVRITVKDTGRRNGIVRLGFIADDDVVILREEIIGKDTFEKGKIYERIQRSER